MKKARKNDKINCLWPGIQVVRKRSAKALYMGANPILASQFCRGAGIGLQDGLKIRWGIIPVWVRVPPAAQKKPHLLSGAFSTFF